MVFVSQIMDIKTTICGYSKWVSPECELDSELTHFMDPLLDNCISDMKLQPAFGPGEFVPTLKFDSDASAVCLSS